MGTKKSSGFCLLCFLTILLASLLSFHINSFSRNLVKSGKAKLITRFPFILTHRGIIIIRGQFGNFRDTLNFILDTGSGGISLNSARVVQFHLTPISNGETIKGISQKKPVEFLVNQRLQLPRLTIDSLNFHINDYSFLSDAHNIKIDGVIGYSLLKSYIIKLNYDNQILEIWKPGKFEYPNGGYIIKTKADKLAAIAATVDDNQKIDSRFYFDTGADICLLLSENFIKDSNVLSKNKKIVVSGGEGLGGKKEMLLTTISHVSIGPYTIKNVPAYIFEDSYNVSNYPLTGGIIGNELMRRFNVVINYPAGEIHLAANTHFNTSFNYSYVGCTIFDANGKTMIKDIIDGSPAHAAGLRNDDIIYGINNNFRNDIEEYKSLFSKAGSKLKVFLLRGNQIQSTVVEVKSIL